MGGVELSMSERLLEQLGRLVGDWDLEASHPAMPGVVVHGTAGFEWLKGERFLIQRSRNDHADFPDSISIVGATDRDRVTDDAGAADEAHLTMHYFDSRGVFRVYDTSIDDQALRIWRDAPGFSQRFTGTFADDGNTIDGLWQLSRDDKAWDDDLQITYRRQR